MVRAYLMRRVRNSLLLVGAVFLDENNLVKLGDFGLSKALAQASFANTYVGVRRFFTFSERLVNSREDALLHVS